MCSYYKVLPIKGKQYKAHYYVAYGMDQKNCSFQSECVFKYKVLCEVWWKLFKNLCDSGNEQRCSVGGYSSVDQPHICIKSPIVPAKSPWGFGIVYRTLYRPLRTRHTQIHSHLKTHSHQKYLEHIFRVCICVYNYECLMVLRQKLTRKCAQKLKIRQKPSMPAK